MKSSLFDRHRQSQPWVKRVFSPQLSKVGFFFVLSLLEHMTCMPYFDCSDQSAASWSMEYFIVKLLETAVLLRGWKKIDRTCPGVGIYPWRLFVEQIRLLLILVICLSVN